MWWEELQYRKTRLIPVLLLSNKGFYKTINFKSPNYLGDPINILKIFNEKGVDELMVLNYRASKKNLFTDFEYLGNLVSEVRYPLTYGGNITSLSQMEKIYRLGVEKIIINSALLNNINFLHEAVKAFGSSSVVGCLEVNRSFFGSNYVSCHSGSIKFKHSIDEHIDILNDSGVGETLIVDVKNDGRMNGLDSSLLKNIISQLKMPVIVNGGVGQTRDLIDFQKECFVEAFGVGSLVVYQGDNKGILINMPSEKELSLLI